MAVIGPGRAGRARIRALEAHPDTELAAVVGREPGSGTATLEAVLASSEIDALLVCTPNHLHAPTVAEALANAKHVAVEFPLAPGAGEGRALFARARQAQRLLHVEHIELLSPSQRQQRERVAALGRPLGGELVFSASSRGWIGDRARAGSPALRALARLHRLVDLFGPADVDAACCQETPDGYRLEVELRFRKGGEVRLVEERGPEKPRQTRWAIRCEGGPLADPAAGVPGELFALDLDCFVTRIRGRGAPYVSEERILHGLELVGGIEALCAQRGGLSVG